MVGQSRAPLRRPAALRAQQWFSLLLSALLILSLTPNAAWAEAESLGAVAEAGATASLADQPSQGEETPSAASDSSAPQASKPLTTSAETPAAQSDGVPTQDEDGVYQLSTVDEVLWFFSSYTTNAASAKLCNDFDLRGTALAPKSSFSGTFDGDGHTLTVELKLASGDKKGLFASNSGTIENLTLAGSVVTTGSSYSGYSQGALVGSNTGTVRHCTNLATVTGTANYLGGLIGYNSGAVEDCTNQGTVTTTASYFGYAGGITGYSTGGTKVTYRNCVNVGAITAVKNRNAGGIIGYASSSSGRATLTNCQTTKTLSPTPANTSVDYWLVGANVYGMPTCTNGSFYQVPVATLEITGTPETGVTLRGIALGATGMEASGALYTWEASDSAAGPFEALASAGTGSSFAIPQNDSLVGKYLRASVTADQNSSAASNVVGPIVKSDTLLVTEAKEALHIVTDDITADSFATVKRLELPSQGLNQAAITWASNNEAVIGSDGSLALPDTASAVTVRLTATLRIGTATATKNFDIKVHPASNPIATVSLTAPDGSFPEGELVTGTELTATALGANGKTATNVTYQWQYAESAESAAAGTWIDIPSATAATWTVPNSYVAASPEGWKGRMVRVTARGDEESSATSEASGAIVFSDYLCAYTDCQLIQSYYNATYKNIYKPCDLAFPAEGANGSTVAWTSNKEALISATGQVTLPTTDSTSVVVTAKVTKGSSSYTYTGNLTVHPLPVALTGVAIEGIPESGQTLTAVAQGASLQRPTNVKYQWSYSSDGARWTDIASYSGGTAATFTSTSSTYGGKYLRVTATGTDAAGQAVSFSSEPVLYTYLDSSQPTLIVMSGFCAAGETLTAQAKSGGPTYYYNITSSQVAWQWFVSTTGEEGSYLPIPGAKADNFTPDWSLYGCYLQVSARTQKGSYVHTVGQVGPLDLSSDEVRVRQAVQLLRDAAANGWAPEPESPRDSSLTALVQEKLQAAATLAGFDLEGITLRLKTADAVRNGAFAALSTANDQANGAISYFFYNPSVVSPTTVTKPDGYGSSFTVTFELTCGEVSLEWSPSQPVALGWDQARIQNEILEPTATAVGASLFTEGDTSATVTHNLNLPTDSGAIDGVLTDPSLATAITSPFVTASWSTSGLDNYYVDDDGVIANRPANDRDITLTGTFFFSDGAVSNPTSASLTKTYRFTLKAADWDPTLTDQERLQRKIDERYQLWNPARTEALTAVGQTAVTVTDDFVVPTSTQLKLPGFGVNDAYAFSVESGNEDLLSINSYRVNVFQPLEDEAATTTLTIKVYERARPWVCATKVYDVTVEPVSRQALEDEIALMEEAKAHYFEAISCGQSADAVTDNLDYFFKVSRASDGSLLWSRTRDEASAIAGGIVPQLVTNSAVPDDNQYFDSSDKKVVTHQNLLVTRPAYDRTITVRSCLSSEKFADYFERYQDDPTWGPLLAQLYRQPVEATFVVKGTEGTVDPSGGQEPAVRTVTASITGVTEHEDGEAFAAQAWVPAAVLELAADEPWSAWDCFSRLLSAHGMSASTEEGWLPFSITNQAGRTLAATLDDPQSYWAFYINGRYADEYADDYEVANGDVIELRYLDRRGAEQPVEVPETNADADHPELALDWEGFTEHASVVAQGNIANASANTPLVNAETEEAFDPVLLSEAPALFRMLSRASFASRSLSVSYTSDPLVVGRRTFLVSSADHQRAVLSVVAEDGTRTTKPLAGAINSTCRLAYGSGIIVIPLAEGAVQALSATTLETLWYVPASLEGAQTLSTPTVANGLVYLATAEKLDRAGMSTRGTLRAFDVRTGKLRGAITNPRAGYYWAGGALVGGAYVIGDDAGVVHAYRPDLSLEVSTLALSSSPLRSTLVVGGANGTERTCYLVSRDGTLHRFSVDNSGQLRRGLSLSFADTSTSTPAVVGSTAYVGGAQGGKGVLAEIDLDRFTVTRRITHADGTALPGEVKSHPLTVRDQGVALYFTTNDAKGCLYGYQAGSTQARCVYQPAAARQNYTMAAPYLDAAGRIGYTNDSGYLFVLKKSAATIPEEPETPKPGQPTEPDAPTPTEPSQPATPTTPETPSTPGTAPSTSTTPGALGAAGAANSDVLLDAGNPRLPLRQATTLSVSDGPANAFTTLIARADAAPTSQISLEGETSTAGTSPKGRDAAAGSSATPIALFDDETALSSGFSDPTQNRAAATLALLAALGFASAAVVAVRRRQQQTESA